MSSAVPPMRRKPPAASHRIVALAAVISAATFLTCPAQTTVPGRDANKLQVLILTGYNMHDWRTMTSALRQELENTGKFQVRVNEEPAGIGPETLYGYDVIVINYTNYQGRFGPTFPQRTRRALLDHLAQGKGIVAYHAALSAFAEWPEYEKLIGGAWR